MNDPRIKRWTAWIDKDIRHDLHAMYLHRYAWEEAARLIADNQELPESYWWEFMLETYLITQAVAIRRQADIKRTVASFARLLTDVRKGAAAITRTDWIGTLCALEAHTDSVLAEREWDQHYGGNVGVHLDPAIPKADAAALRTAAEPVKRYVDTNIAHISADPVARQVTLNVEDIHEAMDTLARLFGRYYTLFTGHTLASLTPFLQHDFFAVFRQPWMREGYSTSRPFWPSIEQP